MIPAASRRVVTREQLEALAGPGRVTPISPRSPGRTTSSYSRLDVARWLTDRGIDFRIKDQPDAKGRTIYVLKVCPFHEGHGDPDSCVMQAPDGALSAQCFHNSCAGRGWKEFKQALGAPEGHHYDPPLTGRKTPRVAKLGHRVSPSPAEQSSPSVHDPAHSSPAHPDAVPTTDSPIVIINPEIPVGQTMRSLTDVLGRRGECYRRAGQLVRITEGTITTILSAAELSGLLNASAEVVMTQGDRSEYRPLPTSYANVWLHHPGEMGRLPSMTLFTRHPVFTLDWRLVTHGYDLDSGIYCASHSVTVRDTPHHLDQLLAEFCFRTPGDRTNYVAMMLTALLMPHFLGSKPAILFTGNQPGLGKSILAQILAILRDGRPTVTATYNPNDEEFEKRLGALVRDGVTTLIIDNAKSSKRSPRIESACLERSITDPIISFRLLGTSQQIRAENSHLFCITANTPETSRDLVTRSVVIDLYYEGDPTRRQFGLADPEGFTLEHRHELLGELLGLVERWRSAGSPRVEAPSRFNKKGWGPIIGGILDTNGFRGFLENAATAAEQLDETRREFAALVGVLADHPQGNWTAAQLVELSEREKLFRGTLDDASPRSQATKLGTIATRYVGEAFALSDDRMATFHRTTDRLGAHYHVTQTESVD